MVRLVNCTTYVFDFDGTLVDSMPTWSEKMLKVLNVAQVEYPENIIEIITPLGDLGGVKYFKEELGVSLDYEEMFDIMDRFALPKYRDEILLKEGVRDYLVDLKNKGYSLNVLTASPHRALDPCLKRLDVFNLFDNVWSCEDFNMTKAQVELYHTVAKTLGVETSDIVFFDDNIGAIRTALKAGLHTVGVFDKSGEQFEKEMKELSGVYVRSFSELQVC